MVTRWLCYNNQPSSSCRTPLPLVVVLLVDNGVVGNHQQWAGRRRNLVEILLLLLRTLVVVGRCGKKTSLALAADMGVEKNARCFISWWLVVGGGR